MPPMAPRLAAIAGTVPDIDCGFVLGERDSFLCCILLRDNVPGDCRVGFVDGSANSMTLFQAHPSLEAASPVKINIMQGL